MPKRWLDPAFFTDEKVAKATIPERQLFAAMIANQDDDGRLLGHPGYLRSIAFPYDDFSIEQIKEMRDHLAKVNPNVLIYQNSGDEYIQLKRHKRYQNPRYYHKSKFPAPQGWSPGHEPLKDDYQGDVEKTIQHDIAKKLQAGDWQPTGEKVTDIELNKRLGNRYADIVAATNRGYILVEVKQYPLQMRDLGQVIDYRSEMETQGYSPITTFLVGKGVGNLDLKEAQNRSVIPLNLDLTPVTPPDSHGAATEHPVGVTEGQAVNVPEHTEDRVGGGEGSDLDNRQMPSASVAQKALKQKVKQAETGIFLDMVEQDIGTKLVQRAKLMGLIRPLLVKFPEATPQSLFDCFKWLKEHDPYCQARDSPMVISMLPAKYPEWAAGRLSEAGHRKLPTPEDIKRQTEQFLKGQA